MVYFIALVKPILERAENMFLLIDKPQCFIFLIGRELLLVKWIFYDRPRHTLVPKAYKFY